jgi:hypothetical protein
VILVLGFSLSIFVIAMEPHANAQGKSWQTFWRQFSVAINNKDRIALKSLMSSERDFFSGGGGDSRDQWIQWIADQNGWRDLQKSVAAGTVSLKGEKRPSRITRDRVLIFSLIGGKWRFVGVMGD